MFGKFQFSSDKRRHNALKWNTVAPYETKQGKKVFKSYCRPMLSLFSLYNAPRAQKSKLITTTTPTPATVLSC